MKNSKLIAVCAMLIALLTLCAGCAVVVQNFENPALRQATETMLDALIRDDFQTAHELVREVCPEAEFLPIYTQLQDYLGTPEDYTLKLLSVYSGTSLSDGERINTTSAEYEMTAQELRAIVSVRSVEEGTLQSFYLTPYEKTNHYATGTLQNMNGATGWQWVFLLLNLVALGVTVVALVDCCRHKIKRKVLWILLIIIGFVTLGATVSDTQFRLSFNVGWLGAYSALIRYGSGTIMLRLMLPIGAIGYFATRRAGLSAQEPKADPAAQPGDDEA